MGEASWGWVDASHASFVRSPSRAGGFERLARCEEVAATLRHAKKGGLNPELGQLPMTQHA